jgi:hypothetical protein
MDFGCFLCVLEINVTFLKFFLIMVFFMVLPK